MQTVLAVLLAVVGAAAQTPADPAAGPVHLATYLEAMPASQSRVAALLRRYRDASRQEAGNLRVEVLQRIGHRHHFALVEAWKDQASVDAHRKAAHAIDFRETFRKEQLAPPDERVLRNTIAATIADAAVPKDAVYVLTHADALPPASRGADLVVPLGEASRRETGSIRFDVLVQPSRLNHFTLVEVWRDRRAADAHALAQHTRDFREKFQAVTGALYDERFYSPLR